MDHQYSDDRTHQPQHRHQFAGEHPFHHHSSPPSFDRLVEPVSWRQHMPPPPPPPPLPPPLASTPTTAATATTTAAAAPSAAIISAGASNSLPSVPKTSLPIQKRRRVTRACDECRRKKIKCDGKQPCTHCTVYSYECTYDQPSNRRRNPAPQYIEALEHRLHRAEAFLKTFAPGLDLNRLDLDPAADSIKPTAAAAAAAAQVGNSAVEIKVEKESLLDSMVESTGRLDIDETGHMDFHGHSSGLTYINQLGILGHVKVGSTSWPVAKAAQKSPPQSSSQSPQSDNVSDIIILPQRSTATFLVETCLDKACVLMRFIHRPSFMAMADRLYDLRFADYDDDDNAFLPLFYLALAVGCLFVEEDDIAVENTGNEAMKYFNAGRRMIEMTDIRHIYTLQAVLLMTIYLQSSTRMSTCYSHVGIALSAAVRMGLHREIPTARFNPIEKEVRRRIFWTCWKMDTYVGAILGLPKGIAHEDIDVEMPAEVDDENITPDAISPQPPGTVSKMAAANAHTRLLTIMAKTVKYIYPIKGVEASVSGHQGGYSVSQSKLHEIEIDLQDWSESLPAVLRPGSNDTPREFLKCQYLLRMSHLHVQMMLYRPFVHYISHHRSKDGDDRSYAIASACVNVSRKIVHTTEEMRKLQLLNGAYWFTIYTTFFSIITLVYYVMVNPPDETAVAVLADARLGRDCLKSIQDRSLAARRCTVALAPPFEQITEKYSSVPLSVAPPKKRPRALSQTLGDDELSSTSSHPSPATASPARSESPTHQPKASPVSRTDIAKRLPSPPNLGGGSSSSSSQFTPASDSVSRRSYELSDLGTPQAPDTPSQQSTPVQQQQQQQQQGQQERQQQQQQQQQQQRQQGAIFQPNMLGSGLSDLSMYSSPDMFGYPLGGMDPMVQQYGKASQTTAQIESPIYQTIHGSMPFSDLEGSILGPVPPYLLQGQQAMESDEQQQARGQRVAGASQPAGGQFYVANGGGDQMVPGFFKEGWDDDVMQTFRSG